MRHLCSGILMVMMLLSVGETSEGAKSITATNRFPDPVGATFAIPFGNDGGTNVIAQTFTAETPGRLLSASVTAASLDPDPTGLQLAVMTVENGQPAVILATSPLQGLYVNGRFTEIETLNAVAHFDGASILLEEQREYALRFVAERFPSSYQILGDQTVGTNGQYEGGAILRSRNGEPFEMLPIGNLVFEVTVETIPEPTTLGLLLIGLANRGRRR